MMLTPRTYPQILRGEVMSIPGAEGDSTYERGGDARRLA